MFQKKRSQSYDNQVDTKKKRVWCIMQLCVVCVFICWHAGYPFLGQLYEVKERILLWEHVTHSPYFEQLDKQEKAMVIQQHKTALDHYNKSFSSKAKSSIEHFFLDLPFFSKWWAVFAFVLPILILLGQRGAEQASIILPILALIFAYENAFYTPTKENRPDERLFPTEEYLISHYGDSPLPASLSDISQQQRMLDEAWHKYLSQEWSPSHDVDEGTFYFTLQQAKLLSAPFVKNWNGKQHPGWLMLYVFWNGIFAWKILDRRTARHKKASAVQCT